MQIAAAAVAAGYNPDFKAPMKKDAPSTPGSIAAPTLAGFTGPRHEISLELGDFLQRIPAQLLGDQKPDPATPLSFEVGDLADRIARGQTTIPVSEIYRRVPGIFRSEILPTDNTDVRFPWQKVMKMLVAHRNEQGGAGSAGLTAAAADSLSEKLRSRRAVRNIIPGSPADTQSAAPAAPPPPAAAPMPKPPEINIPAPNPEEDERMSKEDALKARDILRGIVARLKGEYERQLAAGEQQRKALLDEREKIVVELVRAKKESDDKSEQVEFEKSVAAKSSDNLAKVQQERDAFKLDLSNLKVELSKSGQQNDQRIKDLVTERDALAQQQANLSKQITEFQKRGKIGAAIGEVAAATAGGAAAAAVERSQKEYQRQIEELQRRINVLETGQRDNAQELGREREAKLKAERLLAAADRLQQESAGKVQEMQAAQQRDLEAALRKRELESGAQSQGSAGPGGNAASRQCEIDGQSRGGAPEAGRRPASHRRGADRRGMGRRAAEHTAQFESDIESYRNRIKGLLQEKQALDSRKEARRATGRARQGAGPARRGEAGLSHQVESAAPAIPGRRRTASRRERKVAGPSFQALQAEHQGLGATGRHIAGASRPSTTKHKGDAAQARSENENLQAQLQSLQAERQGPPRRNSRASRLSTRKVKGDT